MTAWALKAVRNQSQIEFCRQKQGYFITAHVVVVMESSLVPVFFGSFLFYRVRSLPSLGGDGSDARVVLAGSRVKRRGAPHSPPRAPRPDGREGRGEPLCARSAHVNAARSPAPEGFTLRLKGDNGGWIYQHRRNRVHLWFSPFHHGCHANFLLWSAEGGEGESPQRPGPRRGRGASAAPLAGPRPLPEGAAGTQHPAPWPV